MRSFIGILVLLTFGNAGAATLTPNGNWVYFWNEIKQDVYDPYDPNEPPIGHEYRFNMDHTVTSTQGVRIDITDTDRIGGRFEVFIDGQSAFVTSETDPAFFGVVATGDATDGDEAWANQFLSKGSFLLGAGTYDISIQVHTNDITIGSAGHIRATAVPIPAAAWLFGSALAGLGWVKRRCAT